jgi:hypothetical protein
MENIFDLASVTVSGRVVKTGYAPYAVGYRGLVELDYTASLNSVEVEV